MRRFGEQHVTAFILVTQIARNQSLLYSGTEDYLVARQDLLAALRDGGRQALAAGDVKGGIGLLEEYVKRDRRYGGAIT